MTHSICDCWIVMPTGGNGTRLRPFTIGRSKALVPLINNFPISEFILYGLTDQTGIRNVVFGVKGTGHYRDLTNYYQGGSGWSAKLGLAPSVSFEYQDPNFHDQGSASSTKWNIERFDIQTPIICLPCDNPCHVEDIERLYDFAMKSDFSFCVGLTKVDHVEKYGIAQFANDGKTIARFVEKPHKTSAPINLANTAYYIIKPEAFEHLEGDFANDTIPKLIKAGKVGGLEFSHPWYDIGNPNLHLQTFLQITENPPDYVAKFLDRVCLKIDGKKIWVRGRGKFSSINSQKIIERIKKGDIKINGTVIIGKHCEIGKNVTLQNCSIGDLSSIGDNSSVINSNVFDAWDIGKNCEIENSMFGRGGVLGDDGKITNSFLGDDQSIGDSVEINNSVLTVKSEVPSLSVINGLELK